MAPTSTDGGGTDESGSTGAGTGPSYRADVLGAPYRATTLALRDAEDGAAVATLVRRRAAGPDGPPSAAAVLHVHGFADYFFQVGTADYWTARGYDFYALDLRRYGRSLLPHQVAGYVGDLAEYDEELDLAWAEVTREHARVLLSAHSTGGLTVPLWLDRRRHRIAGMVLNSPWLDMHGSLLTRQVGMRLIHPLGRYRPMRQIPREVDGSYARSLHRSYDGEWDFDLRWKPLESFTVHAGWLRAVRRGQLRLTRGLDLPGPVLVVCSTRSGRPASAGDPALRGTDVVLDVEQIRRRAPLLGRHVTLAMVEGAVHDVTLSPEPARSRVYREIDRFLDAYVAGSPDH